MYFEWDDDKKERNLIKHGVSFNEASYLRWNHLVVFEDKRRDYGERRWVGYGYVSGRLLCVVFVDVDTDVVRLISLRKANKREVKYYG